jgi:hypothetical protein
LRVRAALAAGGRGLPPSLGCASLRARFARLRGGVFACAAALALAGDGNAASPVP